MDSALEERVRKGSGPACWGCGARLNPATGHVLRSTATRSIEGFGLYCDACTATRVATGEVTPECLAAAMACSELRPEQVLAVLQASLDGGWLTARGPAEDAVLKARGVAAEALGVLSEIAEMPSGPGPDAAKVYLASQGTRK